MRYLHNVLKKAVKPQSAQRAGSKTGVQRFLDDYSVFPFSFSVSSVANSFFSIMMIAMLCCFFPPSAYSAEKENFQFRKQTELQQIKPKKPVKIKLRRSAKDEYIWELSGDDVDEILKTDKKLRKMLNTQ